MTSTIVIMVLFLIKWLALGTVFLIITILPVYFILLPIIVPYNTYKTNQKWLAWSTIDEYWVSNPECKTKDGTKCFHCGSKNIRQFGYTAEHYDSKRLHQCNQCNTWLYRSWTKK